MSPPPDLDDITANAHEVEDKPATDEAHEDEIAEATATDISPAAFKTEVKHSNGVDVYSAYLGDIRMELEVHVLGDDERLIRNPVDGKGFPFKTTKAEADALVAAWNAEMGKIAEAKRGHDNFHTKIRDVLAFLEPNIAALEEASQLESKPDFLWVSCCTEV